MITAVKRIAFRLGNARRIAAQLLGDGPPALPAVDISSGALSAARLIRGESHKPAIMIHGVVQRSGTVYLGELLRLHPDICAYPREVYELPFLNFTERIRRIQRRFLAVYPPNRKNIGRDDFLPLFGTSFITYLIASVPDGQRALFKMPDVSGLQYFRFLFPFEIPLLLLRDGRDLVESTVKTWPEIPFPHACRRWNSNARLMLDQEKTQADAQFQIFRYEDAVRNTSEFMERVCFHCQLDVARYPFDRLAQVAVRGSSALPQSGEVTWEPLDKPANFNPIGRWKNWSQRQKRIFKRICGRTLIECGYADNHDW
ncbi:MAG TPA: sulfotransferase [Nitrospira sp.]|nr:sulfotransferase [Nitrospira sp.]